MSTATQSLTAQITDLRITTKRNVQLCKAFLACTIAAAIMILMMAL